MLIVIGWIACSFVAAWIAADKGRSGPGFFFLSLLLSPLIGCLAAIGAQPHDRRYINPNAAPPASGRAWLAWSLLLVVCLVAVFSVARLFSVQ